MNVKSMTLTGCLIAALSVPALGQEVEGVWAQFKIKKNSPVISGSYEIATVVDGQVVRGSYSQKTLAGFVASICPNGRAGQLVFGEQTTYKKRGKTRVSQDFTTSCADGHVFKSSSLRFVKRTANGADKWTNI